jgi:hypothetical protein
MDPLNPDTVDSSAPPPDPLNPDTVDSSAPPPDPFNPDMPATLTAECILNSFNY